jgi:tetratricopeptide (TPR) repeat protein
MAAWLARKRPYDRSRILGEAARLQGRRRYDKAIALYRQVLEVEPANLDLQRKVASLLARARRPEEAWRGYRSAAEDLVRRGFLDQSIGTLREAADHLPREVEVWSALAALELKRGRPIDAHHTLLQGRGHFRTRRDRSKALQLLLRARALAPEDLETSLDAARLLVRCGERARAHGLLEVLARHKQGRELRRVRSLQLRMRPSPAGAWRWLRALAAPSGPRARQPGRPAQGASRARASPGALARGADSASARSSRPAQSLVLPMRTL